MGRLLTAVCSTDTGAKFPLDFGCLSSQLCALIMSPCLVISHWYTVSTAQALALIVTNAFFGEGCTQHNPCLWGAHIQSIGLFQLSCSLQLRAVSAWANCEELWGFYFKFRDKRGSSAVLVHFMSIKLTTYKDEVYEGHRLGGRQVPNQVAWSVKDLVAYYGILHHILEVGTRVASRRAEQAQTGVSVFSNNLLLW